MNSPSKSKESSSSTPANSKSTSSPVQNAKAVKADPLNTNPEKESSSSSTTPPIDKPKAQAPTSQRRKTFTGCWTCRNRKVKCDLGRPHCNRCLKSKIKCEGYDIKLRWSTKSDKDPDEEYFQRRNIGKSMSIFLCFELFFLF